MMKRLRKKFKNLSVTYLELFQYLYAKVFWNFIRGCVFKFFSFKWSFRVFLLGKGVTIIASQRLILGRGCFISDYCFMNCISTGGVHLGDNVTIREYTWLQLTSVLSDPGESILIGDDTYIGPRCVLGAAAQLSVGRRCQIGSGVNFIAENHKFDPGESISEQGVSRKGILLGDDCWVGNNAIILDGVVLGDGCVVGAGSVVTKSFPPGVVLVGNPAHVLKLRQNE